jgi:hypothetical protein
MRIARLVTLFLACATALLAQQPAAGGGFRFRAQVIPSTRRP